MFGIRNKYGFICLIFALALSACESACYYKQAVVGQLALLNNRRPIEQILEKPDVPAELAYKLELVLKARTFAEQKLHLPVEKNYLTYSDLKRPYAVWVVYAAPEFSLKPRTWYYPVIGRSAYRGYFAEKDAQRYAQYLQDEGFDTYVTGVAAYSTLGWFNDAVLNTMIRRSDTGLAALIFHELAHQLLYVSSDSAFNESFATAVEQEGIRRWLQETGDYQAYRRYMLLQERRDQFVELVRNHRGDLAALYASDMTIGEKRAEKARFFDNLRADYQRLKTGWEGYAGYDNWFQKPLNNAKLISVATYNDFVPAFFKLLESSDGDLPAFYNKCRQLAEQSAEERHRRLGQMMEPNRPAAVYDHPQFTNNSQFTSGR